MSVRQGWNIDGYHFTKTTTERGGTRHFIDGKPVPRLNWLHKMHDARQNEAANNRAIFEDQGIANSVND